MLRIKTNIQFQNHLKLTKSNFLTNQIKTAVINAVYATKIPNYFVSTMSTKIIKLYIIVFTGIKCFSIILAQF